MTDTENVPAKSLEDALEPLMLLRSVKELGGYDLERRTEFVLEQLRLLRTVKSAGAVFAVNVGRMLFRSKGDMKHGEFRAWAERQCGLQPSTITYYLNLARTAERLNMRGIKGVEKLSTRMLLKLGKEERETPKRRTDERAPSNRKAGELNLLVMQLDFHADDDPQLAVEILVPAMERILRKLRAVAQRNRAVRED